MLELTSKRNALRVQQVAFGVANQYPIVDNTLFRVDARCSLERAEKRQGSLGGGRELVRPLILNNGIPFSAWKRVISLYLACGGRRGRYSK